MKAIGHILLAVLLGLGVLAQAAETEKSPAILLQEAIYQEETEGNLDKAIELYGQVLEQAADVERLAARATYQLGMCHLKKGDETAAAEYFRKVVSIYPKQTSVVKKAQAELDKIAPEETGGGLYGQATQAVWSTIGSMYGQECAKAGAKNLYTNSRIYFVNSDFVSWSGGYAFYSNISNETVRGQVRLGGTTHPNQKHYDIMGNLLETEIVHDESAGRERYYHIYLTLPQELAPGQFYPYAWAAEGSTKLASVQFNDDKCLLKMQNQFGSRVFEVFYLVVPTDLVVEYEEISNTVKMDDGTFKKVVIDEPKKQTVGDYVIYAWEKEVGADENHEVTVYLSETEPVSPEAEEYAQKLNQPITVRISKSPDSDKLSIQYAAIAIAEAAGVPYNWDKSAQLADPQRRNYIEPIQINGKTATQALNDLLNPAGLSFRVDEQGIYLYDPKRFEQVEVLKSSKPDPLKAEDLIAEGWKLWGQRKLTEAEDKFKEAIRNDPDNDGAYQGLGWAQLNQGKKQNAEASFKKCVKLNPQNSAALNGLGWIEHGKDNIDMAIKWWEKAVEASNGTATASLSGLTKVYMDKQEYDKAVKYYEMWLKAEPDNQEAKDGLEKAKQAMNG